MISLIIILGFVLVFNGKSSSNIITAYKSLEIRRLPCGRVLQRSVSDNNGTWNKEVYLFNKNGSLIEKREEGISPEIAGKIELGRFVPKLWGNDGALGCLSS